MLVHLRDHRIFYFILAASLFVIAIMLQIRAAYRSYDDDQRLVKLWTQEKQLKDMMSHKAPESLPTLHSPTPNPNPTTLVSHNKTYLNHPSSPPKSHSTKYGTNRRAVTTAGITKAQMLTQKKWI